MGLLDPRNLWWALALGVLVIIHLRSRSRTTLEVSSLMLFEPAPAPSASVRHLRLDWLFWLEAAGLTALVLAIAGLYAMAPGRAGRGRSHALVFDLGAAMSAREGASTRLGLARRAALEIIATAPAGDEFSVITYALEAQVAAPQTANLAVVKHAIASLQAIAVAAKPAALSAAIIRARGSSEIDLFTDRAPPARAIGGALGQSAVRVHQIGHDDRNLAIAGLDPGTPDSTRGRAIVRNFSTVPQLADFAIDLDGNPVLHQPLLLAPREQVSVPFGPLKSGGLVRARIAGDDAIAADNVRWALARSDAPARVLVLSPDAEVRGDLARVLIALDPNFQIETAPPASFAPAGGAGAAKPYALVVMHDCYVRGVAAASTLLIFPPLSRLREHQGTAVARPDFVRAKFPGLRVRATLRSAAMNAAPEPTRSASAVSPLDATRVLEVPQWMDVLDYAAHGSEAAVIPIVAAGEIPAGRAAVIAFDVRGHLLFDPDRLDALLAVVTVTRRLTAPAAVRIVPTGAFVTLASSGAAQVTQPDGGTVTLMPDKWGRVKFSPLEAGRYLVEAKGARTIVLANYYDAAESDLARPRAAAAPSSPAVAAPVSAPGPKQVFPLAPILAAIALGAFVAESIVLVSHASRWGTGHV
ncbi:MAG TPA: BatA domain-containing protein [Candidatus Binataceae bacterium]|nr:BatA domain-containing protein [Candidatus Binataceae bacterium]